MGKMHACGDSGLQVPTLRGQEKEGRRDERCPGAQRGGGRKCQRLFPQSAVPFTWRPSPAPIWISLPAVLAPGWVSPDLPHLHHRAPHRHGPSRTALQDVGTQPAKTAGHVQISYILR